MDQRIKKEAEALVKGLGSRGWRACTAESCTGGLLSAAITAVQGSSAAFEGGAVCYANGAKSSLFGVNEEIFATKGAVSGECAEAMAQGAATLFSTHLAIALTGIAGPGGGSPQKPVGTVFICVTIRDGGRFFPMVVENHFSGSREEIRKQAVLKALRLANAVLAGEIYDDLVLPLALCPDGAEEDPEVDLSLEGLCADGLPCGGLPCFGEELSPFEGALLEEL